MSGIEQFFWVPPIVALLGAGAIFTGSILSRRAAGKPILQTDVLGADFIEKKASGHAHRSWMTRFGGANKCLVVAVAEGRFIVWPSFPFNLLPSDLGLEFDVPLSDVTSVKEASGRFTRGVEVEYRGADGQVERVTLYLRNPAGFVEAMQKRRS